MAVNLSPVAGAAQQFFTNSGVPLAGGLLYTYAAGTTTPQATYTTAAGTTANSNPIVLNSAGRLDNEVWLTSTLTYKFILKDSGGVTIATYDDIPGIGSVSGLTTGTSLLSGNGSGGFSNVVIGSNLSFVGGTLSATTGGSGAGTVTSVALTAPAAFTVAGSPVTSTGTLALTYSGNPIPITSGGTGTSTTIPNAVMVAPGTGPGLDSVTFVAPGTAGNVLTSNGSTWTSAPSTTSSTALAVGTYCFARVTSFPSGTIYPGTDVSGSYLIPSGTYNLVSYTTTMPGTWRCMGFTDNGSSPTLFLRIS
jgi:hypothetical protein